MGSEPEHRAGGKPAALRSVLVAAAPSRLLGLRFPTPSFSRRTPGPRDHRALGGGQKDIGPPRTLRQGGCCFSREPEHRAGGISTALRYVAAAAAPPRPLGPRFPTPSFSRRTPRPRDHRALAGGPKDIGPPRTLRQGGCCFSREPEHRSSRKPTALRSAPWQRHHRGSWAPAFAGETNGE